ncbi:MAG: class I SAM-dependent methyltransferase [Nitrosomonadales bacterium]|nr:class I SAM-dependent methyltransferase [Nitrosomonadales bacterium]
MKFSYAPIRPIAGYSPWAADTDFMEIHEAVRENTMVDIYRLHELYSLVRQLGKLPEGDILEVGVWRGGSGALLARTAALAGLSSRVFLADTFRGVVKAGSRDSKYTGGEHADTSLDIVENLLGEKLKLENFSILQGVFPEQTGAEIAGRSFRLCHIDVDVYESARDVNEWVWPRLVPGGMVVYDDYGFEPCVGVTRYVNEQLALEDRLILHNLNGHALVIKLY